MPNWCYNQLTIKHDDVELVNELGVLIEKIVENQAQAIIPAFLDGISGTHDHAPLASGIGFFQVIPHHNFRARREIRPLNKLHEVFRRRILVFDKRRSRVQYFSDIVRRNVRGHTDGNTG